MAYINKETIRANKIEIYQRDEKGVSPEIWYAHLRINGEETKRLSLKTTDKDEAEDIALEMWQELNFKHKNGYSLNTTPFKKVAKEYLIDYQKNADIKERLPPKDKKKMKGYSHNVLKEQTKMINTFIIPILGNTNINDISDDDINDYIEKRTNWWTTGTGFEQEVIKLKNGKCREKNERERGIPNFNTVNRSLTAIRAIFKYAKDKKLIAKADIPEIQNVTKPDDNDEENLTPSFTDAEMRLLNDTLTKKVNHQDNPKHYRSNLRFALYVAIMSSSGMRTSDTRNLKIKHCHIEAEPPYISVSSKNNKREVIPLDACWDYIKALIEHHKQNATNFGWKYSEEINLFSNDYGKPITTYISQLARTLNLCGLSYIEDDDGVKRNRNTKSFRPYYITKALEAGISIDLIARNVGNSPSVIRQHYDRMRTRDLADKLQFQDGNFSQTVSLNLPKPIPITIKNKNSFLTKLIQRD